MLAWNKLRVEPSDGSAVEEYRIADGRVEMRALDSSLVSEPKTESGWRQLTREEPTSHVMAATSVARWLECRMGLHPLIRACTPPSYAEQFDVELSTESRGARFSI